jgi:hypothetical protein
MHIVSRLEISQRLIPGVLAGVLIAGCASSNTTGDDAGSDPQADLTAWSALVTQLDMRRHDFLGTDVQELAPVADHLYWLDTTNFDFALRSYDDATGARLAYTFSIGRGDLHNYRASADLVVTAEPGGDPIVYHAYQAGAPRTEVATTTVAKPPGAQWAAYAVSGATAYIVDTSVAGQTQLLRWTPGQDPVAQFTLESAGVDVGEFQDFDVQGTTMIFIESGRIWTLDLTTQHATWLMNRSEVNGAVDFRSDGVMFESADGVMFYDLQRSELVNITAKINANPFQVNTTFASAAKYYQGFARWRSFVLYVGNSGVFSYDLAHDTIVPILLSPDRADLRVDYRYPVVLDGGTAFVTGLTSTSGATGADGPTYKLDLRPILP